MRGYKLLRLVLPAAIGFGAASASAQTITVAPIPTYTCTANAVAPDASEQFPDCRFNLQRMQTRRDIVLTFEIGGGLPTQSLQLVISPREFGQDPSAQHVIPFPRAPVVPGIEENIRTARSDLSRRTTGDTLTFTDAAAVWRIAIWADLGSEDSRFSDADALALKTLRDSACRALLEKFPTYALTRRSIRGRRLAMCSQNQQLVDLADEQTLAQLPLLDLQVAQMDPAGDPYLLAYVQETLGEAREILSARAAAGMNAEQYNYDLNTLSFRFDQARIHSQQIGG